MTARDAPPRRGRGAPARGRALRLGLLALVFFGSLAVAKLGGVLDASSACATW
jgi:hypothetical protein